VSVCSDPTVQHPTARSSSRIFVVQLLVRLILTIAFPLFQSTPSLRWVLVLLYMIGCGSVAFLYTWYLPVWNNFHGLNWVLINDFIIVGVL
jgi:hypothetical protein